MYYQYRGIILLVTTMKKFDDLLKKVDTFVSLAVDPGEITRATQALTPAMQALITAVKANYKIMPVALIGQAPDILVPEYNIDTLPKVIAGIRALALAYTQIEGNDSLTWRQNVSPQAVQAYRAAVQLLNGLRAWRAANSGVKQT